MNMNRPPEELEECPTFEAKVLAVAMLVLFAAAALFLLWPGSQKYVKAWSLMPSNLCVSTEAQK